MATSAKVLELRDHALLLPLYGNTPTDALPSITILRSRDGGRTWAPTTQVSDYREQASAPEPVPKVGLLQTWGDRSGAFGAGLPTIGRLITPAGDRRPPRVVYSGGATDERYPSTVQVGPGLLFTVYHDAAHKIIGGTYSRVSDYI